MDLVSRNITNMTVPHLFLDLWGGRKTGIAVLERDELVKKVHFQNGDVLFATSTDDSDTLGECLFRAEIINQAQYEATTEIIRKTGKKAKDILVELGFISLQDLSWCTKLHAMKIVQNLFSWREGTYRFDEGPLPPVDALMHQINTRELILKSVRGVEWKTARRSLPPMSTIIRPVQHSARSFDDTAFSEDEIAILGLINGQRSIVEICSLSGGGDFNTLTAIYQFFALKMVEAGEAVPGEEVVSGIETLQEDIGESQQNRDETVGMEPDAIRKMLHTAFDEMDVQNHYQVLGIRDSASADEIKKAYFRLAKLYHPDRHHGPEMEDIKSKLESLFARLTEAYATLSDQARRDEYNLTQLQKAKKLVSEADRSDRTGTAANQFNKGMKEYKAGNFWGALEAFRWASRLDPGNARFHYYQGMTLTHMPRRNREAEESFKKAIELDPSNVDYYIDLGNFYMQNGLKLRAQSVLREAMKWNVDSERLKQAIEAGGGTESSEGESGGFFQKVFGGSKK